MNNPASLRVFDDALDLIRALIVAGSLVVALCVLFPPQWETNDDVAMSMIAHGYGIAAISSPNLVFSNVVWGHIVRAIPSLAGIPGYSLAALSLLVCTGTVVFYTLRGSGAGWIASISVLLLVLVRPVLFPQFTINAGLITLAALLWWYRYGRTGYPLTLITGGALGFIGILVRNQEFLLVLAVGAPFMPWRVFINDRFGRKIALVFLIAVAVAVIVDHGSYAGADWRAFDELNSARAPITDFGADAHLKEHPEILGRYGYTSNDVDLLRYWFFIDPMIADAQVLEAMLTELGPLAVRNGALLKGWLGLKAVSNPILLPLLLPAIVLFLLRPYLRLLVA